MRSVLVVAASLAFATPAFADAPAPDHGMSADAQEMAAKLNSPAMQGALTAGIDGMMAALLNMRIDGIAKAVAPLNNGKSLKLHGNTLRDNVARNDPHFEDHMHEKTHAMVGGMGALASALATMMPQLEAAMAKMGAGLDKVGDASGRN
jgi:hypothetical protein